VKIITLNTWGGRAGKEGLLSFFKEHADDTDIFCLQEVWSAPYHHIEGHAAGGLAIDHSQVMTYGLQEITAVLSGHTPYFHPHHLDNYGLLLLVKKDLIAADHGEVFVHKHKGFIPEGDVGHHARNVQYVTLKTDAGPLTVGNFHGLWNGKGKTDSPDRLNQSKNILKWAEERDGEVILCGDFNLLPDTESIKMLEDAGLKNLIREFDVRSTRTSHYTKPEKYADYVFHSEGVNVKNFYVLTDEVSDHAPLALEIL